MGVLRTAEDTFEEQANVNSFVTDQHYAFSIPTKGSSSYFPLIPKNYAYSQVIEKDLIHTINSEDSDQGIVQVFQANQINNISGFNFLAQAAHNGTQQSIVLDEFEYTDNDSIREVWRSNDSSNNNDDGIVISTNWWDEYDGLYCLQAAVWAHAEGNYFEIDITEHTDWTNLTNIEFQWMASKDGSDYRWKLQVVDDNDQVAEIEFNADNKWDWEEHIFKKELFRNSEILDWGHISKLRFYCKKVDCYYEVYMDNLKLTMNTKDTKINTKVSLIHFGTDPEFSTLGNTLTLDNNFDYEDVILEINSKRVTECNIKFAASSNSQNLIQGDYYGLKIHKPSEGNINIYGDNNQSFSGGNFYDIAENGDLTALNKSLSFMICTFTPSTLKKLRIRQDVYAAKSNINLLLIDPTTFKVVQFLGVYTFEAGEIIEIDYDYSKPELIETNNSAHLYVYYQDDYNSEATKLNVCSRFHYSETGV